MAVYSNAKSLGFTVVELVAVIIVIGILGAAVVSRTFSSGFFQVQSARDSLVVAFSGAQQRAMAQSNSVRLILSGSTVDIREDSNNDSTFSASESVWQGGVSYPITLEGNVSLSGAQFDFDRLGETTAGSVTLSKSGNTLTLTVTAMGYVY